MEPTCCCVQLMNIGSGALNRVDFFGDTGGLGWGGDALVPADMRNRLLGPNRSELFPTLLYRGEASHAASELLHR